ncbi:glycosyltransferase [Rhizobium jaguaris]
MGRYVTHLIEQIEKAGYQVTILLYRDCYLTPDSPLFSRYGVRFANYSPEDSNQDLANRSKRMHEFTAYLSALLEAEGFDSYVDATPFLGPARLDIFSCPVTAVCYDFIPLRYPDSYLNHELVKTEYYNGLARLSKADHIVCISETVRDEAIRYLGIHSESISVVCPSLEERYFSPIAAYAPSVGQGYLFAILGSHKSKNPKGSVEIYGQLLRSRVIDVRLNAPKQDQFDALFQNQKVPAGAQFTVSVTDEEKFEQQSGAKVIGHLSLEEGFGIPLLEAAFLGKKILALDTPINRELLKAGTEGRDSAVFWLPPRNQVLNIQAFLQFLEMPVDPQFHESIRNAFITHWAASSDIAADALGKAAVAFKTWWEKAQAKIFSSIPGSSCGVADYSVAYTRSATGNIAFFYSEGQQQNISHLRNVRVFTYLDFKRFTRSKHAKLKGLFNFAFSSALNPGIELMRTSSQSGDVLLIHERRYFDGLRAMQLATGQVESLLLDITGNEPDENRTKLAIDCVFRPEFNSRNQIAKLGAPISSGWLSELPIRAVSHLSPAVVEQMRLQETVMPGSVINDLQAIEETFEFVPLGIDDRRNPAVDRASRLLRVQRGVQMDDIVVGHHGLILNDLKRLWDVASAIVAAASQREKLAADNRRIFFFLVGKVIDTELFERIQLAFAGVGLGGRLIHSNPAYEDDFDAEIAACDAVACFRTQTRGQLSHVFVRALSLGTPVLVNERSGYGYDPRTTIREDDVTNGIFAALDRLADPGQLADMRKSARQHYESHHRGDASLKKILRES